MLEYSKDGRLERRLALAWNLNPRRFFGPTMQPLLTGSCSNVRTGAQVSRTGITKVDHETTKTTGLSATTCALEYNKIELISPR